MSRLLSGELRRVLARRMVRVLALLALAGIALAGILTFVNSEHVDAEEMASRRRAAAAGVDACMAGQTPTIDGRQLRGPPPGGAEREEFCQFAAGRVDDPRSEASRASCRARPRRSWSWHG